VSFVNVDGPCSQKGWPSVPGRPADHVRPRQVAEGEFRSGSLNGDRVRWPLDDARGRCLEAGFYNLSQRFRFSGADWHYFEDVKNRAQPYMSKSGSVAAHPTSMHTPPNRRRSFTWCRGRLSTRVPLRFLCGSGIVISLPKKLGAVITYDDLEQAAARSCVRATW